MTSMSMREALGRPVLALDTAELLGSIRHFSFDASGRQIERIHIDGRKSNAQFVEWSAITVGTDRAMAASGDVATGATAERDIAAARGAIDMLDARVLDTAGFERGRVQDATFDPATGQVLSVTASEGETFVSESIRGLGSYALIVEA
jgi:uncharacterized protein YrrD